MSEREDAIEITKKALALSETCKRLSKDSDFQTFLEEFIDKSIENLRIRLENSSDTDFIPIKNQLLTLRELRSSFNAQVERVEEVSQVLRELEK